MSQEIFKGSCLCGQISYQVEGEVERFYHCHCLRCRKTTGTAHASNISVHDSALTWLTGEDLLRRFKVPEAERFYNHFCIVCGSSMPREVPEMNIVVIPAGTLDSEFKIKPEARIFWESRSDWSCSGDDIKTWPEYPS